MHGARLRGLWTLSEGHQKPSLCVVGRITATKDVRVLYGSCMSLHGAKRVARCDQVKALEMARGPWTIHVSPIESHGCESGERTFLSCGQRERGLGEEGGRDAAVRAVKPEQGPYDRACEWPQKLEKAKEENSP